MIINHSMNTHEQSKKGHYEFKMATMIRSLNFAVLVND